ncbi:MAG: hypothetical protein HRU28_07905 [Rhizobiales bacterium]|nr:hypothetical protein [Hyphomicrobiales bacterium]
MSKFKNSNLSVYFALYWFVFWLFNGLDKFLFHSDLGLLTWYGKDRDWQFSVYMTNMQVPTELVKPILYFSGTLEILISTIFAAFIISQLFNKKQSKNKNNDLFILGLKISILTFIGFCGFDVVAGDRAELLEHSTYIGVLAAIYIVSHIERMVYFSAEIAHTDADEAHEDAEPATRQARKPKYAVSKINSISNDNLNQDMIDENDMLNTLRKYRDDDTTA